ncbi:MAG: hypothetical protein IBX71_04490 [Candidatus Desulforudis sp.]|nr:hypothetical protein [Desulforudis sp.]
MDKPFAKEIMLVNRIMLAAVALIIIAGTAYYGGTAEAWLRSLVLLGIIGIAYSIKFWRIKKRSQELDERLRVITHAAMAFGFYAMLAAVFWFYMMELIQDGAVSTRTVAELGAGFVGYVGAYFYLRKKI